MGSVLGREGGKGSIKWIAEGTENRAGKEQRTARNTMRGSKKR